MVNHILKIISISDCLDISYVFLYLKFRPFIFTDAIKSVTLFITYTLCNNFIFIFNSKKVQSYRRNNSIEAGKVNAKTVTNSDKNSVILVSRFFAQKDLLTKSVFLC